MSILFINLDKRWGGGQEYLLALSKRLLNDGHEISHLFKANSTSSERFENASSQLISFNPLCPISWMQYIQALLKAKTLHIQREHDLWLALIAKIIKSSLRIIYSQQIIPRKKRLLMKLVEQIIVPSEFIKGLVQDLYNTEQEIHVIYPILSEANTQGALTPSVANLTGQPRLMMSGSYAKNQAELIPIIQKVLKELPNTKLYLIGPSAELDQLHTLREKIQKSNLEEQIIIINSLPRNEYLALLQEIDIFVYVFTREAFGMAIYEAAQYRKPIIAYKGGGINEILENYSGAKLIEYGNAELFAKTVIECAKKSPPSNTLNEEQFNAHKAYQQHLTVYRL